MVNYQVMALIEGRFKTPRKDRSSTVSRKRHTTRKWSSRAISLFYPAIFWKLAPSCSRICWDAGGGWFRSPVLAARRWRRALCPPFGSVAPNWQRRPCRKSCPTVSAYCRQTAQWNIVSLTAEWKWIYANLIRPGRGARRCYREIGRMLLFRRGWGTSAVVERRQQRWHRAIFSRHLTTTTVNQW